MTGCARRGRQDERPAPLELFELSELVDEWASPAQRRSGASEAGGGERPWGMEGSKVRFLDTFGPSDDDVQGMLGSLFIRAEIGNKETEDFQRVVKSLRSGAKHLKAEADRYRKALENLQRKHEQLQSETTALFAYNRELFFTAEDATTRLAKRATGDQPFWRRLQLAIHCGRACRGWRDLCVARRRTRVAMRIVYRRRVWRYKDAVLRLWKMALHFARFARTWLGVWRRASSQQRRCRERRGNIVLLSVLSRRARRWRLEVMRVWLHIAIAKRKRCQQDEKVERVLLGKRRQALNSAVCSWHTQAVNAAKRRRAVRRMDVKTRDRVLRSTIIGWEGQVCGFAHLRSVLCRVFRRTLQRGALNAWRVRALGGGRRQRETLRRALR